jgi:hypothetical protein
MKDQSNIITRDFMIMVDAGAFGYFNITFEVKFKDTLSSSQPGLRERSTDIIDYTPIYVLYSSEWSDMEWRYGENMPERLVDALEKNAGSIYSKIEQAVSAKYWTC